MSERADAFVYLLDWEVTVPGTGERLPIRGASTPGYQTHPGDVPSCAVYPPIIVDPGTTESHLFARGTTRGRSTFGKGSVTLNNASHLMDVLAGKLWDGSLLTLRRGPVNGRYPQDFPAVSAGRIRKVRYEGLTVVLEWADAQAGVLDLTWVTTRYGGSNSGGTGVDGEAGDLQGRPVPWLKGNPGRRIPAVLVNRQKAIYQVSRAQASGIANVANRGNTAGLALGQVRATRAALEATQPAAGTYDVYLGSTTDGAYFRLVSVPDGTVTCDATEGGTGARTLSRAVEALLTGPGGVDPARIDRATFDAVHGAAPAETGFWLGPEDEAVKLGEVVDQLTDGLAAWLIPNELGTWSMGLLRKPYGVPVKWFDVATNVGADFQVTFNVDTDGIPCSSVVLSYLRNFTVQPAENLAPAIQGQAEWTFAQQQYRQVTAARAAGQPQHTTAKPLPIETRLFAAADAQARADAAQAFYGSTLLFFSLPVPTSETMGLRFGDTIGVRLNRFPELGLVDGIPALLIGAVHDRTKAQSFLFAVG